MTDTVEYVRQGRPPGSRNKRTAEIFRRLEARGDLDPADFLSSLITDENESKELRVQASGLLMPYKYGKHGSIPPTRYPEDHVEIPKFTSLEVAVSFLAEIPSLVNSNRLDLDFANLYREITMGWIQSQYAKQGIDLKAQAQGATDTDTVIRIEGGLPALPGTNVTMPSREINGKDSYKLLETPQNPSSIDGMHTAEPNQLANNLPVAPIESPPTNGGQDLT